MIAESVTALVYGDVGTEKTEPESKFAEVTKAPRQAAGDQ
jgi:hypothetical protein